jgi:hypothetical protein
VDALLAEWGSTDKSLPPQLASETCGETMVDNLVLGSGTQAWGLAGNALIALWATGWLLNGTEEETSQQRRIARAWSLQK